MKYFNFCGRHPVALVRQLPDGSTLLAWLVFLAGSLSAQPGRSTRANRSAGESLSPLSTPIQLLLANNKQVQAAEKAYQAATASIRAKGKLPDPMIEGVGFVQPIETRNGPTELQIMLGQKIPLWGKLRRQRQIAEEQAAIAALNLRHSQVEVVWQMRTAWEDYLRLERSLQILKSYREELNSFRSNALAQYSTGGGITQHPILKLQIEISLIESKINSLQSDLQSRNNDLVALFDGKFEAQLFAAQRTPMPPTEAVDFWLAQARELNPGYRKSLLELEIASLQHELARRKNYPDLLAGVTYSFIGPDGAGTAPALGKDAMGVKVGLNIPLWFGKNRARVQSAELMVASKDELAQETWNRLENGVRSTLHALHEIEETYLIYGGQLIGESEQMLASAFSAYETGKISFLDVLDSQRMVVRVRLEFESVEARRRIVSAKLLKATGATQYEEDLKNEN
ncbi:MAG: TolC family protein [Candidatus Marinimicrobia bacterium]|nr:TolC family protein [Candidatus Neomarinimicrobiota bacterium]